MTTNGPNELRKSGTGRWLARCLILALAYALTGCLSLLIPHYMGNFGLVWLPAGIAAYFLLRFGPAYWPGITLGSLLISVVNSGATNIGVSVAVANTIGPCLIALLLRRWRFDPACRRPHDILLLGLAGVVGMLVATGTGSAWLVQVGRVRPEDFLDTFLSWWTSDTLGIVLLTPALLALHPSTLLGPLAARPREFAGWALGTAAWVGLQLLHPITPGAGIFSLPYLTLPLVVWAALRFGLPGVALGVLTTGGAAILGVALRLGPFIRPERGVELVQLSGFVLTVTFVGWLVWSLGCARDQSEAELRASRESAELSGLGSTDGFWDWDIVHDRGNFSERWIGHLGYTLADMAGQSNRAFFDFLVHPDDRATVGEHLRRHLEERVPYSVELRMRAKDGSYRSILSRGQAIWDAEGRPIRMAGSHSDITNRLKEQEHLMLLEVCLAHLHDMVVICEATPLDEPGPRIVYVNEGFTRVTGYARAEALGRSPRFLQGPKSSPATRRQIRAALAEARALRVEVVNYKKDGAEFWMELDVVPVFDARGRLSHFVSVQRDISARKQAEAERAAIEDQLRAAQKTETLGRLAGGIAHNFNNLLTGINGFGELARMELPAGHPAVKHLNMALRVGDSATELVRQILAFARRAPSAVQQPVELGALAREVAALVSATLPAGIQVRLQVPDGPRSALGESSQFQQVLMNLCLNGAQAIEPGEGVLQISVADAGSDSPLAVPAVCLTVEDNGCGMDEKRQKLIFEPFFTTKPPGKGTGLGLSVVQGIVDSYGGQIRVRSQSGAGSRFEVFLPVVAEEYAAVVPSRPTRPPHSGHGESVLVIDDQLSIVTFVCELLERSGYRSAAFTSAGQGLAEMVGHPSRYRLLIVDLSMPEMSGIEVIRQARKHQCDHPIILISGDHDRVDLSEFASDTQLHLLPKPFGPQALLEVVRRYMADAPGRNS